MKAIDFAKTECANNYAGGCCAMRDDKPCRLAARKKIERCPWFERAVLPLAKSTDGSRGQALMGAMNDYMVGSGCQNALRATEKPQDARGGVTRTER